MDDAEALDVDFVLSPGGLTASVTVTAARSERDTLLVPVRAESIPYDKIEEQNPTSTGDALVLAASVTPVGSGPFQVRPRLCGLDSTRLLILVDGERLNNARTATDRAGVEVGLVDSFSLQSAEVVSGAGSVLYGTDALAGTINLITNRLTLTPELKVHLGFDGYYSSNETRARGGVSVGVSDERYAIRFAGSLEDFGNYRSGKPANESSAALHQASVLSQADTIDDNFGFNFAPFPDPFNAPFTRTSDEVAGSSAQGSNINVSGLVALSPDQNLTLKYSGVTPRTSAFRTSRPRRSFNESRFRSVTSTSFRRATKRSQ